MRRIGDLVSILSKSLGLLSKLALQTVAHEIAKSTECRIGDGVVDLQTPFPAREDAGLCQDLQMPRDVGLETARAASEVSGTLFSFEQLCHKPEPGGVSQSRKAAAH